MSGAQRRWIRLDVDWEDSPWLDALDGTAAGCWPRILCLMKRSGVGGEMRAPDLGVLARRWRVPLAAIKDLIQAAEADGALVTTGGGWALPNWDDYQRPDLTAASRMKRYRKDKSRLSPLHRNTVTSVEDTPNAGVTRRVTETLTLTGTEKTTSTPTAAVRVRGRKKRTTYAYTPMFQELWKIRGRGPKPDAFEAYQEAIQNGACHETMTAALGRYVREQLRPGFDGCNLSTWIEGQRWEEYANGNGTNPHKSIFHDLGGPA